MPDPCRKLISFPQCFADPQGTFKGYGRLLAVDSENPRRIAVVLNDKACDALQEWLGHDNLPHMER